jgi:hypothetical protein
MTVQVAKDSPWWILGKGLQGILYELRYYDSGLSTPTHYLVKWETPEIPEFCIYQVSEIIAAPGAFPFLYDHQVPIGYAGNY